jgi:hypothetical protein
MIATKTNVPVLPRLRNRLEDAAPTVKATPDTPMDADTSRIELLTCHRSDSSCTAGMLLGAAWIESELDQSRQHLGSRRRNLHACHRAASSWILVSDGLC